MIKNKKNIIYYILSFIIPLIIFSYICYVAKIYPFGDILINKYDSFGQYTSFLIELISKLKMGGNFFYTLHAGCGSNFLGIFNLYASSPLNLLFIFFKSNQVYSFYILLTYLKIGLSGLSLFLYLKNVNKKKLNVSLIFSTIYALSSFSIVYCYHIMWSDAFYMVPLILLGIDKLVDDDKILLYTICLSIMILINFYIAYMICIFCVIYFIYKIVNKKENKLPTILKFLLASLISGLIGAVVLIPSGFAILSGRSLGGENYLALNLKNLEAFFYNLTPASFLKTDNYNDGTCVIGCTMFIIALVAMYFFNKKFSLKQKITVGVIILFFFISFSFNAVDFAWNMLARPVWWNSRYAYLFSLFLIIIAYNSFINIKDLKMKNFFKLLLILVFFVLILTSMSLKLKGSGPSNLKFIITMLSIIYLGVYLYLISTLGNKNKQLLKILIILFMILTEITYNGYYLLTEDKDNNNYYKDTVETLNRKVNYVNKIKKLDSSFYRIYDFNDGQENNGMIMNFNSPQVFSSVYNKNINEFYSKYLEVNDNLDETVNHTKISYPSLELLSLINVKYIIDTNSNYYYQIEDEILKNNYALPFGFLIENNKSINLTDYSKFENTEKIYSYLANKKTYIYHDVDESITYNNVSTNKDGTLKLQDQDKKGEIIYDFVVDTEGILSPRISENLHRISTIYINGAIANKDDLIYLKKDDKVSINYSFDKASQINGKTLNDLQVNILDVSKFKEIINKISQNEVKFIENKEDILSANVIVKEDNKKLFMSLPYDDGLIIKVDNKKTKVNKEFNTFISINLTKGKHNIKINYLPKGFKLGLIISLITIFSSIILFIIKKFTNFCK